jgi:hypothetical protein
MAAITAFDNEGQGTLWSVRNASAQANTGQTDWLNVPSWARACTIYIDWTATAGTTPLMDFKLLEADPINRDDGTTNDLDDWDGITQLSGTALIRVLVGPHRTSTDDTGTTYHVGTLLPQLLGLQTTLDRTSANETYTYTINVVWER